MLHFDHGNDLPRSFSDNALQANVYFQRITSYLLLPIIERAQTDMPHTLEMPHILKPLTAISNGRCAFCEGRKGSLLVARFRPASNAYPSKNESFSKEFYIWFAHEWTNFFPICDDCHDLNTKNIFPITGQRKALTKNELLLWQKQLKTRLMAPQLPSDIRTRLIAEEKPVLFAPGQVGNYGQHFSIDHRFKLIGKTVRAKTTIEHYNLNILQTRRRRSSVMVRYLNQLKTIGPDADFDFTEIEYGGAWYLTMKRIVAHMLGISGVVGRAYIGQIHATVKKLYVHPVWSQFDAIASGDVVASDTAAILKNVKVRKPNADQQKNESTFHTAKAEAARNIRYSKSQPQLKSITIKNFKSLQDVEINIRERGVENTTGNEVKIAKLSKAEIDQENRTPCLLMLGENATGKSSLLEAVALAAIPAPVFDDLREKIDLKPKSLILNPKYMGNPKGKLPRSASINLEFKGIEQEPETHGLKITRTKFSPEKPPPKSDVMSGDLLVFAYGAHRLFGNTDDDVEVQPASNNVITLFRNDVMTIDPEKWLIEIDKRDDVSLHEIASALRHVIQIDGAFQNIEIIREKNEKPFCQINLKRSRNIIIKQNKEEALATASKEDYIVSTPLKYVSSGYRVIIALICDVFKGIMDHFDIDAALARKVQVLILIDEIEAHLHPRWKLEVILGLRKALPNATFVMSSHDPLCIRGMNNGEVVVFNRFSNAKGSGALTRESIETITDFPDFRHMTIEQLLTSDLFQMYSSDDKRAEHDFVNIIKLLEKEKDTEEDETLTDADEKALKAFRSEISKALPVGMGEAERVVQHAVAKYLAARRDGDKGTREQERANAEATIMDALAAIAGGVDETS